MVHLQLHPVEFFEYLEINGCKKIDQIDGVWIYRGTNGELVPIQDKKLYYPRFVVKTCEALGVQPPDEFVRFCQQLDALSENCSKTQCDTDANSKDKQDI